MEQKVHRLIEESAEAVVAKDMLRALEKAKEAFHHILFIRP
jgi:hypothetical protein